jgi:hypothetical protein
VRRFRRGIYLKVVADAAMNLDGLLCSHPGGAVATSALALFRNGGIAVHPDPCHPNA